MGIDSDGIGDGRSSQIYGGDESKIFVWALGRDMDEKYKDDRKDAALQINPNPRQSAQIVLDVERDT